MMVLILACVLAILLGFAAHRASVCMVRGVAEVLSARTGYMLASIAKSMAWVLAITIPFFWLMPSAAAGIGGWQLTAAGVLGGFIFGLGAGINGACAYSTMARLVDGEGAMLVTVTGFAIGVLSFVLLLDLHWASRPTPAPALVGSLLMWALLMSAVVLLWATYEFVRLWRTRTKIGVRELLFAPSYRLSSSAVIIGLAGATVFLIIGPAGYSSTFELVIEGLIGTRPWPSTTRWVLVLAVLLGMLLSTLQRGTFRIDWRPRRTWLRNLFGGALMGLGVALAPGGNDMLVLYGIPSLSPHAVPTFIAMAIGIALALLTLRYLFRIETRVTCRNDVYVSESGLRA
jgi:uncharacterized membrane protein YedE/YeeE